MPRKEVIMELQVLDKKQNDNSIKQLLKVKGGCFFNVKSNFGSKIAEEAIIQGLANTISKK